jgi:hypothetical protein
MKSCDATGRWVVFTTLIIGYTLVSLVSSSAAAVTPTVIELTQIPC